MGKRLIQQARGKGSSTYRAHSFRFAGKLSYNAYEKNGKVEGLVIDIIHCKGHSAPLMEVKYESTGNVALIPSFEGVYIGKTITVDQRDEVSKEDIIVGNAYQLKNLADGTQIFNIELTPGDSGKIVRTAGAFATVITQNKNMTKVVLPSKKEKLLNNKCRAFVGIVGGGGRLEKPILKAGKRVHEMRKKNKLYPKISGVAQSAVDHPFGSTRSLRKGRPTQSPKNAPPGRKVGMIRPRHTGRNK